MKGPSCLRASRSATVGIASLIALVALSGCLFQSDPVAILASSVVSGPAPLAIGFDLSYSMHPKGKPMTYTLDFGDGSEPAEGTEFGIIVQHTYEEGGVYDALLTVADDNGRRATDSLTITVSPKGPEVGIEVGMSAPDFTAPTTDGGEFTLSDARGQVVLLDFWGAWCLPCRRSLPHLAELLATYGEDGVIGVLISTDTVEQDSIVFLTQNGFTDFVSVWEPGGKFTPVAELYGVLSGGSVGIPHTFVLDRQGVIRWVGHPLDLLPTTIESLL
jgi:peroxiredoxin